MKRIKVYLLNKGVASLFSLLVLCCTCFANTRCCYIFHDENKPEELNEFKKY